MLLCYFIQPGTPPARPYEAPTPGSGWTNTPGNYSEAGTPRESSPAYGELVRSLFSVWNICRLKMQQLYNSHSVLLLQLVLLALTCRPPPVGSQ